MDFTNLNPDLQEKVLNAKTAEEILALAKEEGYELSDEELDGISGGWMIGGACVGVGCACYDYDY